MMDQLARRAGVAAALLSARAVAARSLLRSARAALALAFCLLVLVQVPSAGADDSGGPPPLNEGPMIHLEERSVELGDLSEDTPIHHSFNIRNDGTKLLEIKRVETSCGCTTTRLVDSLLAPGQSSDLEVNFNPVNEEGEAIKIIVLFTNDPAEPRIDLRLHANIIPTLVADPKLVDFGMVRKGDTPTITVRLTGPRGANLHINRVTGGEGIINWTSAPVRSDTGSVMEWTVHLNPDLSIGKFARRIVLNLDYPRKPLFRMGLSGEVYSYFHMQSDHLDFYNVRTGTTTTKELKVDCDGSKPYRITDAESSSPMIRAELKESGHGYVVALTLNAPPKPERVRASVILKTTDPAQPQIEIQTRGVAL